ncbi:hypothetical protein ACVXHB_20185 [Escherichia coli]
MEDMVDHDALSAGPRHQPSSDSCTRRLCTEPVKSQARDGFGEAVGRVFDTQNHRHSCLRR